MTRSYVPASTGGALSFSTASSGSVASSSSHGHAPCSGVPTRYSQPRPAPEASERIVSTVSLLATTTVTSGLIRTRCCSVVVPARSA